MARTSISIPVHNRRETTLHCLRQLAATGVLTWAEAVVVDDGSSDGTSQAVRSAFPQVTVLPGDGTLWWGGATRLGMEHAMGTGADFLVWLNDDCQPDPGTLRLLVEHAARTGGIAAGWAATPSGGRYGGFRHSWRGLSPVTVPGPGEIVACDAAAGNCVVFSRSVVEAIGLPDAAHLPHALLDADYTLMATRRGFPLDLLGSAVCRNDDNLQPASESWLLGEQSPMAQWKLFLRPHSTYGYRASFRMHWKHWGLWGLWLHGRGYLKLALICAVRAVIPLRWLRALFGHRSAAYRRQQFHEQPPTDGNPASTSETGA